MICEEMTVATFASKNDTDTLVDSHGDVVVILVEGKTDEKFLEKMFPGMETEIRFESVGGCTLMVNRLKRERVTYPKVFGLLDRDALKRDKKWSVLFETDDEAFAVATRVDGLYVLTRWEIENYLLDFIAVQRLFANWGQSVSNYDADTLLDEMIAAASAELYVTAGWCTAHAYGLAEQDDLITPCMDPHALQSSVLNWIQQKLPNAVEQHNEHIASVRAFDPGETVGKRERLIALLRMVDGKRFLERLQRRWLGVNRDPSFQLADNVGGIRPRRDDLYRLIQSLAGRD
jgi:hypothetical protein